MRISDRSLFHRWTAAARLGAAVILTVAGLGLVAPLRADADAACFITHVAGSAEVSARGAGRFDATPGLGLGRNATLRTEAASRVRMTCPDGLAVVIGPQSAIAVAGFLEGASSRPFGVRLMNGIAGFLFDRTGGDGIQVNTPSAVAAVRSTEWAMRVENAASAVFSRDGTVFVFAEGGTARLRTGDGVDVSAAGEVGPVVRWGRARIDLFADLLGPRW